MQAANIIIAKMYNKIPCLGTKNFRGIRPKLYASWTQANAALAKLQAMGINAEIVHPCASSRKYIRIHL